MHLHRTAAEGRAVVGGYPIVEYGELGGVARGERAGTVEDGLEALAEAGVGTAWVLGGWEPPGPPFPPGHARHWPTTPPHVELAGELRAYNEWLCDLGAAHPSLLPFPTLHPGVLGAAAAAAHLAELVDERGARGLKLHPIGLRAHPDDPALEPTLALCAARALPVVCHCGPDRHGAGWSVPGAFAPVMDRHPDLVLVLAHLGGAAWRETAAFAAAYPQVRFDLSEVIAWVGAPKAPTPHQLVELITTIGHHRVLLGSDFPWYDPADTMAELESLPGLSAEQREAIVGENAAALV